ncbi:guanylate cyclase domain-containing protein [Haematococcus lacustris]|uniref:Guanylate cyclase domain-containing protein n=1 Tax=Haematococcus lacustris TaxID=44745 RepID=A0A699YE25_HAELA|nr:guanylate cyclase domain-containing protein [Haematococcus lacustris]
MGHMAYLVMFYRRDLFSALGLAPPDTWEQLLQLATNTSLWTQAAVVNTLGSRAPSAQASSGLGAAGTRPAAPAFSGLCLPLKANCTGAFLLMNIWASLTQYLGLDQGLHFEPLTMQPLVDSPAMDEAMRLYARLAAAASPDSLTTCGPLHPAFLAGSCAITVGWDHYFSYTASQPVSGSVGVAPLPGSTRVWDRQVSRGSPGSPLRLCRGAAGLPRNADQAAAIHCPHATPLADGSWVNQAPLSQFFYTSM